MYQLNKLELLDCLTKNCEQNYFAGEKVQVSRLLDVFGGPTGISKGLKKRKIPEGSGV